MIEVRDLSMHYGTVRAVDSISFTAVEGRVMGLLGPNGAGKSTTMNMLAGHIVPTSGVATIGGHDVVEDPVEVRKLIGYLPEREPLYPDMEVAEFVKFVGSARGLSGAKLKERMEWSIEACSLKPVYRKLISDLSRGYRQRTGLAQALIHDPPVLILDELTSGLDPLQTLEIRKLVKGLARGNGGPGKCIIFSTHVMQEAQAVSDRIVIINHGRIVANGEPEEIKSQAAGSTSALVTVKAGRETVETQLGSLAGAREVEFLREEGGLVSFVLKSADYESLWEELSELIKSNGWPVKELTPSAVSLEDAFLALTRRSSAENEAPEPAASGQEMKEVQE